LRFDVEHYLIHDRVADPDLAVAEDVGAQAAAMGERGDGDAGEMLEMDARLA